MRLKWSRSTLYAVDCSSSDAASLRSSYVTIARRGRELSSWHFVTDLQTGLSATDVTGTLSYTEDPVEEAVK